MKLLAQLGKSYHPLSAIQHNLLFLGDIRVLKCAYLLYVLHHCNIHILPIHQQINSSTNKVITTILLIVQKTHESHICYMLSIHHQAPLLVALSVLIFHLYYIFYLYTIRNSELGQHWGDIAKIQLYYILYYISDDFFLYINYGCFAPFYIM